MIIKLLHILKIANKKFDNGYNWFCWEVAYHLITPLANAWEKAQ